MKATENVSVNFYCNLCDYGCSKTTCWNQHLSTSKHDKATNGLHPATKKYACEKCHTNFKHHSSYYRHKKKCNITENDQTETSNHQSSIIITTELVMELIKDNKEMKQIILEQNNTINNLVKNGTNNNTNAQQ
jgi:hypothetical protein